MTAPNLSVVGEDDIKRISRLALHHGLAVAQWLAPDGKLEGSEWVCLNPRRADKSLGSCKINVATGKWGEFIAGGAGGGDLVSAVEYFRDCRNMGEARQQLEDFLGSNPSAVGGAVPRQKENSGAQWERKPDAIGGYRPSHTWAYLDASGALVCEVWRFPPREPGGKKNIVPMRQCADGLWRTKWPGDGRPLFNLDRLSRDRASVVVVVEGEKCADAVGRLIPGCIPTTSMSGAKQPLSMTDWKPLAGRQVLVWADADDSGQAYAAGVAEMARKVGAAGVRSLVLESVGIEPGSKRDAADLVEQGWDSARFGKESRWESDEFWTNGPPDAASEKLVQSDLPELPTIETVRHVEMTGADDVTGDPVTGDPVTGDPVTGVDGCLVTVPMDDLMTAKISPPAFVVSGLVPRGQTTLLGGHGGSGKSYLALVLGACLAAGRSWGPVAIEQGKALFVSLEDDAEILRYRLRRIIETYELDAVRVMENLRIVDGSDAGPLVFEQSEHGVRRIEKTSVFDEVAELAKDVDLAIVDNASEAFNADSNNTHLVKRFIKMLTKMVKGHKGAVLLLAHIDKAGAKYGTAGNSYSGSAAWNNSVRSRIALIDDELRHEKTNHGPLQLPNRITWNLGVPVPFNGAGMSIAEKSDDEMVLEMLRVAARQGLNVSPGFLGQYSSWDCLKPLPGFPPALLEPKVGRQRTHAALARLAEQGKIVREEFRNAESKKRERWAIRSGVSGVE